MKFVKMFCSLTLAWAASHGNVSLAAGLTTSVLSNSCNVDSSIRLAEYSPTHYNAFSSLGFSLVNKSCEVKFRVKAPAGHKVVLKDFFSRGKVTFFGATASGSYGMSVRTADGSNYVGGSLGLNSTQNFSVTPNYRRGSGSACGGSVDIIVRHDGSATQISNTQMKVDYHTFYVDQVRC